MKNHNFAKHFHKDFYNLKSKQLDVTLKSTIILLNENKTISLNEFMRRA